jgi:hypothetical protein
MSKMLGVRVVTVMASTIDRRRRQTIGINA